MRVLNVIVDPGSGPVRHRPRARRSSTLPLADDQAALVLQGRAQVQDVEASAYDLVAGPAEVTGRCTLAVVTLQRS